MPVKELESSVNLSRELRRKYNPDEPIPKYYQIQKIIRDEILNGTLKLGDKLPSVYLLADQLNVTKVTTDKAFDELEKEGLVKRAQGKGTFVTEPKPILSAKEVVGLVMPTAGHLYEIFSGQLIRVLAQNDLFSLVVNLSEDLVDYRQTQALIKKQPPFLLVDGTCTLLMFPLLKYYQGHTIFMHLYEETEGIPNSSYVLSDLTAGGAIITEHLITMGYQRIIHYTFLSGQKRIHHLQIEDGIRTTIRKHGLPEETFACWIEDEGIPLEERLKAEKPPFALIGDSDSRMQEVYKAAGKLGMRIPDDIGLVGWYNTPWCETFRPHLTSVSIREDLIAGKVVEVITDKTMQGKKIFVSPELVIRDSTRRVQMR